MSEVQNKKVKHHSKKHRSAWRKHVNIDDVEHFLEDKRLEERLGPPIETLLNDDIFQIDHLPQPHVNSKKYTREQLLHKPIKCFSMLESYSKVPDPIKKRNHVKTVEERQKERFSKHKSSQKNITKQITTVLSAGCNNSANIWIESQSIVPDQWVNRDTKLHNLLATDRKAEIIKKPISKKTCALHGVEYPHPGLSYNPSYQDHQRLLHEQTVKKTETMKTNQHLQRTTTQLFRSIDQNKSHKEWLIEASEGLNDTSSFIEHLTISDSEDYKCVGPPVLNKKKTLKQRRKQREQRKVEVERLRAKIEKKKRTDLHNIAQIQRDVEQFQHHVVQKQKKRNAIRQSKKNDTKRLCALKYKELDTDFNHPHELSGNLRNIRRRGTLLVDRFNSLQKRNIIQPTKMHKRRTARMKTFIGKDFKDDWKSRVALNSLHK